ncbi:Thiol-disulfide isomerase or thioredoxin [Amphibacillus marinus]|uniref:Thiol-disulfide isomerase or thioredoxin n=1 Tax=Amphibacillus marinus TaxID=872970 RepID=A0A1H8T0Q0_9BACI|nr:thioredoxin family protein [Amphibacillus marinus]SEO84053.1 Thiol-disulfide isomerase or thioredoxin [Amphibacillus marinus]
MEKLQTEAQFEELKQKGKHVFMFSADWCPDCRIIEPFLPELEEAYQDITFLYVDRDQFIDLCVNHDIFGIPSFLAFNQGEEVDRFVSKDRKTREEIESFLNKVREA